MPVSRHRTPRRDSMDHNEDSHDENGLAEHVNGVGLGHANGGAPRRGRFTLPGYLAVFTLVAVLMTSFIGLQVYLPLATECGCHHGLAVSSTKRAYNSSRLGVRELLPDGRWSHSFVVVTDLDHDSRVDDKSHKWRSYLKRGSLIVNEGLTTAEVRWDPKERDHVLESQISAGGRGMELSDLVVFDGHLLTVDDRTGIIYRIVDFDRVVPWAMLNDGPGDTIKGFKAEWMSVKDQNLWVGGLGKEWTTTAGEFVNNHPMYVKVISRWGEVEHVDWTENYKRIREAVGIKWPGYMIHESAQWSELRQKWFFLPRRASKEGYDEVKDEHQGTNLLLITDSQLNSPVEVKKIGSRGDGSHGFSAFQFLPHSDDEVIVALKSQEKDGVPVASYILVFNVQTGKLLLEEEVMPGAYKFEGLAFV